MAVQPGVVLAALVQGAFVGFFVWLIFFVSRRLGKRREARQRAKAERRAQTQIEEFRRNEAAFEASLRSQSDISLPSVAP